MRNIATDPQSGAIIFYESRMGYILSLTALIIILLLVEFTLAPYFLSDTMLTLLALFFGVIFLIGIVVLVQRILRFSGNRQPFLILNANGMEVIPGHLAEKKFGPWAVFLGLGATKNTILPWKEILQITLQWRHYTKFPQRYILIKMIDGNEVYLIPTGFSITKSKLVKILEDYRLNGGASATTLLGEVVN